MLPGSFIVRKENQCSLKSEPEVIDKNHVEFNVVEIATIGLISRYYTSLEPISLHESLVQKWLV